MKKKEDKGIRLFGRGPIREMLDEINLILRLMRDPRIHPVLKALPIASLMYFVIFPDLAPGPIDDAFIVGIGTYLFVELCSPEIVKEHRDAIEKVITTHWRDADDDIIEGNHREG